MNNPARPNVGDRLTAIRIPYVTHNGNDGDPIDEWEVESLDFTVTRLIDATDGLRVYGDFSCRTDSTGRFGTRNFYAIEWKPVRYVPAVGDKVRIVPGKGEHSEWYGIGDYWHDKPGIVTSLGEPDDNGLVWVHAEFASQQKPDDTISFRFPGYEPWVDPFPQPGDKVFAYEPNTAISGGPRWVGTYEHAGAGGWHWVTREGSTPIYFARVEPWVADAEEPITFETRDRMVGKTIKVIRGNYGVTAGELHAVVDTFHVPERRYPRKVDGITVGVRVGRRHVWVQEYEVVEDGHTLTVSDYVPAVGDYVRFTGCLEEDGIRDGFEHFGTVHAVTGDIWEITGVLGGKYVSGPGYVFAAEQPEPEPEAPVVTLTEVEELRQQLARANERVEQATTRAGKWERDFMRSWQRIGQEATERNWCSEYERVVSDVEETLEIGEIPARVTLVERRVRITGTVYRDVTVWVQDGEDATDPDNWYESNDPDDHVSEDFMSDQIDSEYSNNGFDDTEVRVIR
jgi:hypothetical protein